MKELLSIYLFEVFGEHFSVTALNSQETFNLPLYIRSAFELYTVRFFSKNLILAYDKEDEMAAGQLIQQIKTIAQAADSPVALVVNSLDTNKRRKLISDKIDFIVPGKQLFLPSFFVVLKEGEMQKPIRNNKLIPTAQMILVYALLKHDTDYGTYSLRDWAGILELTPEAVSKGEDNLHRLDLCTFHGSKEKSIRFEQTGNGLWHDAEQYMVNPVTRQFFTDKLPDGLFCIPAGESALPEYTDMAPSNQVYKAVEKRKYDAWKKTAGQWEENNYEGKYCIQLWRYNPLPLAELAGEDVVDPISLYLSLKNVHDERIEIALDQIIEQHIW